MSRTTARLTALVLASGALLGGAALPASAADHDRRHDQQPRSSVVLGQIRTEGRGAARTSRSLNEEWVTVTNDSRRTVNLRNWTLTDSDGNRYTFRLRLGARDSVRVHTGSGRDTSRDVYQNRRTQVWDADRDTATLRDDRGRVVDVESWGRQYRDNDQRRGGDQRRDNDQRRDSDYRGRR